MQSDQSVSARPPVEAPGAVPQNHMQHEVPQSAVEESVEHIHLPPPTIWPMTTAAGVTLGFLGLVSSVFVSYLGIIIAIWGIVSWIQELRHERH
jgi:hypothetical protein